jgi:DNA topoisomerase-1
MEDELDNIAQGKKKYYELCDECNSFITSLINSNNLISKCDSNLENGEKLEKLNIKIDAKHTYLIGKNGPIIKFAKEDGSLGFYGVKKDINIEKLKEGGYKLEELIETKEETTKLLGVYNDENVYLKNGKFGYYLECGQLRKSLKTIKINVPFKEIKIDDALIILKDCDSETNSLVRRISNDLSIRKGKYGDYLFYKTPTMKKPQFFKLGEFNDDYKNCSLEFLKSWIKEKYAL